MCFDSTIFGVILGALIAGVIGFLSYLGIDLIRGHWTRKNVIRSLIAEIKLINNVQTDSSLLRLPHDAWDEAKRTGVLMRLTDKLRNELMGFYSKIFFKNGIVLWYMLGTISGNTSVSDPDTNKTIHLASLLRNLKNEIQECVPRIIEQLNNEL